MICHAFARDIRFFSDLWGILLEKERIKCVFIGPVGLDDFRHPHWIENDELEHADIDLI